MRKSVLIIGSGLLGQSIAEKFSKNGYKVSITTTTKDKLITLQNLGYHPIIFNSNEIEHYEPISKLAFEILVFALPPSKCKTIAYTDVLINVCDKLRTFNLLVFTSSTSVYLNNGLTHTEESKDLDLSSIIVQTEQYIKKHIKQHYIFRLGGLIDKQRHPKSFHKNLIVKNSNTLVNLVHIKDVASIIYTCIDHKIDFGTYNVCSPEHPSKKEYYGTLNNQLKFEEGIIGKTIDSTLLSNQLHFKYTSIYDFTD